MHGGLAQALLPQLSQGQQANIRLNHAVRRIVSIPSEAPDLLPTIAVFGERPSIARVDTSAAPAMECVAERESEIVSFSMRARAVVLTPSPPCLLDIAFDPPLPSSKRRALEAVEMGLLNLVCILCAILSRTGRAPLSP